MKFHRWCSPQTWRTTPCFHAWWVEVNIQRPFYSLVIFFSLLKDRRWLKVVDFIVSASQTLGFKNIFVLQIYNTQCLEPEPIVFRFILFDSYCCFQNLIFSIWQEINFKGDMEIRQVSNISKISSFNSETKSWHPHSNV